MSVNPSARRVLRMLALVPYLQSKAGVPVETVAREFGVRPRQIRDDLMRLMMTGVGELPGQLIDVDLEALEHDDVVYLRDAEFMTRPLRLNAQEGIALIVALRTLRASAGTAQLPIIDQALAKLETAVGEDAADAAVDVQVLQVDATIRDTVAAALADGLRLRLDYATAARDEHTSREVDPIRMFTDQGQTYLEAYCRRAEDLRFFRLDRILAAELSDLPAERHETPGRALGESWFGDDADVPSAVLDLEPSAWWMLEYYPAEDLGEVDGLRRVRMRAGDEAWLRRLLLRHAGAVHVVEPLSLREQVADSARSALAAYSG